MIHSFAIPSRRKKFSESINHWVSRVFIIENLSLIMENEDGFAIEVEANSIELSEDDVDILEVSSPATIGREPPLLRPLLQSVRKQLLQLWQVR